MRILWVSPFLPHPEAPHAGGRAIYQWLSKLSENNDITLLCRLQEQELPQLDAIRPYCEEIQTITFDRRKSGLLDLFRIPFSYFRLGRIANRLSRSGRFDLLHVEYVETGLGIGRHVPIPRILIAHDELSKPARRRLALATELPMRAAHFVYWFLIGRLERRILRKFDRTLALSESDRHALLQLDPALQVGVLPIPVGIEPLRAARESNRLVFVGSMHRDVNVDAMLYFCREILPLIRNQWSNVRLSIVGNKPPPEILSLGEDPNIQITGFVPTLEPYYATATIFVAPLRIGGGIIVKILNAMAAGCPVVTTNIGNEGIGARPGVHLLTADEPEAFAQAVLTLLRDEKERIRLAENARAFVEPRFNIATTARVLEELYGEVSMKGALR
ncbi:MAG: glycosyltransferase family 4 protein [Alphaproteobacteria bacterium]